MRWHNHVRSIALTVALLAATASNAQAGRLGGPLATAATAPGQMSVFINVTFEAGGQAVVTVVGDGSSIMNVMIYDSEGHVATGIGSWDRKTATMDIHRTGEFRIEVRNMGLRPDSFTLNTN